jgi:hypothetical protein
MGLWYSGLVSLRTDIEYSTLQSPSVPNWRAHNATMSSEDCVGFSVCGLDLVYTDQGSGFAFLKVGSECSSGSATRLAR